MLRTRPILTALGLAVLAAWAGNALADKGDKAEANSAPDLGKLTFVHRVAFSPDGKSLLVEYKQPPDYQSPSAVGVWDLATGKFRVGMEKSPTHCEQIAWSPDGKKAAAISAGDKVLKVWDADAGKATQEFALPPWEKFTPAAPFLAFSPDGTILTSVLKEKILRAKLGGEAKVLPGYDLGVWAPENVSYSPTTDVLILGVNPPPGKTGSGAFRVCDLGKDGEPRTAAASGWIRSLALAPGGKILAVSYEREFIGAKSVPGKVELLDAESWKPAGQLPQDKRPDFWSYRRLAFSPDGKVLAGAPGFGKPSATAVEFVDLKGKILGQIARSGKVLLTDAAVAPDGKTAAVVVGVKPIQFLDLTKEKDNAP